MLSERKIFFRGTDWGWHAAPRGDLLGWTAQIYDDSKNVLAEHRRTYTWRVFDESGGVLAGGSCGSLKWAKRLASGCLKACAEALTESCAR